MAPEKRDTIPRLHRIAAHVHDQVMGIADGESTFEAARLRYGATQERLARDGRGRLTASRVSGAERNWAPTRDVLSELIRIGALEQQRVPSARKFLDAHRNNSYVLTDFGRELAAAARGGGPTFVDALTRALIAAHPYLRGLLGALAAGPIICPAVNEGDVERGRRDGLGVAGWGVWAADCIGDGVNGDTAARIIGEHLRRRFGSEVQERPANKAIAEAMNDALMVAGFSARGLDVDANSIKTLLRWGTDLLLFDQSRYVPRYPDANTIWLACDLETIDGVLVATRRGMAAHGDALAAAIVSAYRQQAQSASTMLAEPYLPIHGVRAQAAFETQTMRRLADLVLTSLVDGGHPTLGVSVDVHIGTSQLPNSEPPYRHHDRRRLEMTVTPINTTRSDAA